MPSAYAFEAEMHERTQTDLAAARADNARLRALIKRMEHPVENRSDEWLCFFCRASSIHGKHNHDCPAFTLDGEVR